MDDTCDRNARSFNDRIHLANLKQLAKGPTHQTGHTLDLILMRALDDFITDVSISNPLPSDHALVESRLSISKPKPGEIMIKIRKYRDMVLNAFRQDILLSPLYSDPTSDLYTLIEMYESVLSAILDKNAPEKSCKL